MGDHTAIGIGLIGNYYGGLKLRRDNGISYWSITDYDGDNWDQIPDYLAEALLKYRSESEGKTKYD